MAREAANRVGEAPGRRWRRDTGAPCPRHRGHATAPDGDGFATGAPSRDVGGAPFRRARVRDDLCGGRDEAAGGGGVMYGSGWVERVSYTGRGV